MFSSNFYLSGIFCIINWREFIIIKANDKFIPQDRKTICFQNSLQFMHERNCQQ